jgi:hypothetical protein
MPLLHILVGDGQLDGIPSDLLNLRLLLRADGNDHSVSSSWSGGTSLFRFQSTVHIPVPDDPSDLLVNGDSKGTVTTRISFDLIGGLGEFN